MGLLSDKVLFQSTDGKLKFAKLSVAGPQITVLSWIVREPSYCWHPSPDVFCVELQFLKSPYVKIVVASAISLRDV